MRFIAIHSNVKESISNTERATGDNLNLPILKNILIKATSSGIVFTATNLDLAVIYHMPGKVIENGEMTVPMGIFSNLINNIKSDRINFEKKNNTLQIKTDNYQAVVQGMTAEDFPVTPKIADTKEKIEIKGSYLKQAIQQTIVAAQFSDLRPELNTILFSFSIDTIKLVATDGFRLAEKTLAQNLFNSTHKEPFKILIPLKASQEAMRLVRDEDMVEIFHDDNQVLFKTERAELISRLIEGGFPDYLPLIPKKFSLEAIIEKEEFLNAIRLAGIFGQRTNEVKILAQEGKKTMEVSSADQALGENSYILAAKIKGETPESYFNWRFLADPIKVIEGNEVFIGMQEEGNPALIRPAGDSSYLYILKPILKS